MSKALCIVDRKSYMPSESITEQAAKAWKDMEISKDWQIFRLKELAAMFERRLSDIDPQYPIFPYGEIKQ